MFAAGLAILGGFALCALTLYATIYEPLHYHFPVNFGESLHFGDILVFAAGAVGIAVGALLLSRPGSATARGAILVGVGLVILLIAVVFVFPDTFHLDPFNKPFYFGFAYFAEFGQAEIGTRFVQVPLVIACAMLIGAGLTAMVSQVGRPPVHMS